MSGYKAYQGKQIEGAGPLGLVLLSYDALYKSLGRAKLCIEAGETGQEADHTARAMEAIIELSSSLNFDEGEDIAINLANLYKYMMDKLASGMCSGKVEHIVEVMGLVETLHAGWQQLNMEQKARGQHTFSDTAAVPHAQTATPILGYAA